jgi:hypothetical protein
VLSGQGSLIQAFVNLGNQLGSALTENILKQLVTALNPGGPISSLLEGIGGGAEGGAGSFLSGIPLIGSLFGGGAGAAGGAVGAAFSGPEAIPLGLLALSRGGIIPSAARGWTVPSFQGGGIPSILHSNEMVLPADISQGLQSMIAGGGGGHTFNLNVRAWDGRSVMDAGPQIVASINKAMRNGSMARVG